MEIKKTILIVEDEVPTMKVIVDKLTQSGYLTLEAKNGEEGLTVALSKKPDLILLDVLMPKMDGVEMMKKVRESGEWGKSVPIIILTNISADDRIMTEIVVAEPAYYLMKTEWPIDAVMEKIQTIIGNGKETNK